MHLLLSGWQQTLALYATAAAVFTTLALGELLLLRRTSGPPGWWLVAIGVLLTFVLVRTRVPARFMSFVTDVLADAAQATLRLLRLNSTRRTLLPSALWAPYSGESNPAEWAEFQAWRELGRVGAHLDQEYREIASTFAGEVAMLRERAAEFDVLIAADDPAIALPVAESFRHFGFKILQHNASPESLRIALFESSPVSGSGIGLAIAVNLMGKDVELPGGQSSTVVITFKNAKSAVPQAFEKVFENQSGELSDRVVSHVIRAMRGARRLRKARDAAAVG